MHMFMNMCVYVCVYIYMYNAYDCKRHYNLWLMLHYISVIIFNFKSTQSLENRLVTSCTFRADFFPTAIRCWHLTNWGSKNQISVFPNYSLQNSAINIGMYFNWGKALRRNFETPGLFIASLWYGHNCSSTALMSTTRSSFNIILWWMQGSGKCQGVTQCIFWKIYPCYLSIPFRKKKQKQKQKNKTKWKTDLKMRINPQYNYKKLKKFHVIPDSKILFVIVPVVRSLLYSEQ